MIINASTLSAMQTGFQKSFQKSYAGTSAVWPMLAMATNSNAAMEGYPFTGDLGLLQEYFGELSSQQLEVYLYTLKNRKFGKSYSLRVEDIERDDHLNILPNTAVAWGRSMKLWGDKLIGEQVKALFDGGPSGDNLAYDGDFMCGTSHPVPGGSGTYSNKITKALDFSTFSAAKASFGAAKDAMQAFVDHEGEPLILRPDVLVVGPDLEDVAVAGMTLDRLEDGKPNIYKGKCKPVVFDWMNSGEWFIASTTAGIKPFIFQTEKKPMVQPVPGPDSDQVRKQEIVDFAVKARGTAGFGEPRLIVGSTGTT